LSIDATSVYWGGAAGIMKVAHTGGTLATLARGDSCLGAVGGAHVYWTTDNPSTVRAVAVDGGSPITLATGGSMSSTPESYFFAVVVDAVRAYWLDVGSIETVPVDGGAITTLGSGAYPPRAARHAATEAV
jgi:hypothetical protein